MDFGREHTPRQKFSATSLPDITVSETRKLEKRISKDRQLENRLLWEGKKHAFKNIYDEYENIVHKTHFNPYFHSIYPLTQVIENAFIAKSQELFKSNLKLIEVSR